MQIDKITLADLSIFSSTNQGVFDLLNRTRTNIGAAAFKYHFQNPPKDYPTLIAHQSTVRFWMQYPNAFPEIITNGTIVMLEEFLAAQTAVDFKPGSLMFSIDNFFQKKLNKSSYSFNEFSLQHVQDFSRGLVYFVEFVEQLDTEVPSFIKNIVVEFKSFLAQELVQKILQLNLKIDKKDINANLYLVRKHLKHTLKSTFELVAKLDMWSSMAKVSTDLGYILPEIIDGTTIEWSASQIYHPLLKNPKKYDIDFQPNQYLLLLTGANMSGKSTFMRTLGVIALLAHVGMGVPAEKMKMSFLQGIITNMHVNDNLMMGESFFFAEVQRMKSTAQRLQKSDRQLVLMDELFKGTNVHDAYECTLGVVNGLLKKQANIMVLSTHLYELYDDLKSDTRIHFQYFETHLSNNGNYAFTYHLKEGVSNDKIGYLVLKKEGVLDLLN